jgi:hypothetical protein
MTQAEIEAKLETLGEQLSRLHERQESRNKLWLLIGLLSLLTGVGSVLAGAIIQLVMSANASSLMLMGTPLIFLSLALFVGMKDTAMSETASVERDNTPAQAT